jgi:hypothetical protein
LSNGETILCVDESPYRHVPATTQRWAKQGSYPTISPVAPDWRKVSAIDAVALWLDETDTPQTKVFFRLRPDENVTSNLIRDFFIRFDRR